jgi:hypothetical protein
MLSDELQAAVREAVVGKVTDMVNCSNLEPHWPKQTVISCYIDGVRSTVRAEWVSIGGFYCVEVETGVPYSNNQEG